MRAWYPWYVVGVIAVASMFAYLDRSVIYLLVEPIRADLGISDLQMSLLQGPAFGLLFAFMGLPIAFLADRSSRKLIMAVGIALWSLMTMLCGFAQDFGQLFLARVGVGVGEAALVPASVSLLADYFTRDKLGRANAFMMFGAAAGGAIAIMLGGWLLTMGTADHGLFSLLPRDMAAWQRIFLIVGFPGLLVAAVLWVTVAEPRRITGPGMRPLKDAEPAGALKQFLSDNRSTVVTLLLAFPLLSAATTGWLAWMPTFFIRQFDVEPPQAASMYGLIILLFGMPGTVLGGVINDMLMKRGYYDSVLRTALWSAAGMALAGGIAPLVADTRMAFVLSGLFLFFASFLSPLPALCVQLIAPPRLRARIIAGIMLATTVIGTLGPTVVASFTDLWFADDSKLGLSLLWTSLCLCIPTLFIIRRGLPNFTLLTYEP